MSQATLKILHVIAGMNPKTGGVCQAVRTMIKGLDADENSASEVVCLDAPGEAYLKESPFPIHAMGPSKGPWVYSSRLIPWLESELTRFDIVVIHGLWLYHGYAVLKAFARLRKSGVPAHLLPVCHVMPHGMLDPYFQEDPARRLKALRNRAYWHLIERNLINHAAGVLFTCDQERLLARKTFGHYHPRGEAVVGLGVEEPPAFTPEMQTALTRICPQLDDRSFLLFLSRIHPKKGVDLLIRAYVDWLGSRPETEMSPPVHLVIAGPIDSEYARKMQQLAASLFPAGAATIHFPGMLSGDAKWGAFHRCQGFVLPSHQENFGIAVVEALACGKPVLISNKVNIWREIADCGAGLVSEDTEAATRLQLAEFLSASADTLRTMSRNALRCFHTHYRISEAADRLFTSLAPVSRDRESGIQKHSSMHPHPLNS
jgi:glycosyltransferase involved in cell wall biosynthesis